jgi:hypothetical protein
LLCPSLIALLLVKNAGNNIQDVDELRSLRLIVLVIKNAKGSKVTNYLLEKAEILPRKMLQSFKVHL